MGDKLIKYYQWAEQHGGLMTKVRLAQKTKVPSVEAALRPDDAATIKAFRDALREIASAEPPTF